MQNQGKSTKLILMELFMKERKTKKIIFSSKNNSLAFSNEFSFQSKNLKSNHSHSNSQEINNKLIHLRSELNSNLMNKSSMDNVNRGKSIINILLNKNKSSSIPIKNEILSSKIHSQRSLKRQTIDENKFSNSIIKNGIRNSNPCFDVNFFQRQILKHKSIDQISNVDRRMRSYFTLNLSSIK